LIGQVSCANSVFAGPSIRSSFSSRCTMQDAPRDPLLTAAKNENASAFARVPLGFPAAGCTTIPAGLLTIRSDLVNNVDWNILGEQTIRTVRRQLNLDFIRWPNSVGRLASLHNQGTSAFRQAKRRAMDSRQCTAPPDASHRLDP